jgi:hypothetical protein
MRSSSASVCLTAITALALCLFAPHAGTQAGPKRVHSVPIDPRLQHPSKLASDPGDFAWEMFYALDWPALPAQRGKPDPSLPLGAHAATVWESFKNIVEIYLNQGQRPPGWQVNIELPPSDPSNPTPAAQAADLETVDSTWVHYLAEPYMIDLQRICGMDSPPPVKDPKDCPPVYYEVRDNRATFEYIVNNPSGFELFNFDGQLAARANALFKFNFPTPALEVKGSWRILQPGDDPSRYWTAIGVYCDDYGKLQKARIGLTGLHIISKFLPNWVWMTFEQVDNPTKTFKWYQGRAGAPVGPNPTYNSQMTPINAKWQAWLRGTKWQYYALMDVQTEFVDPPVKPTLLSNTQMETYFQPQSSCITCHKVASIGTAQTPRLNFFPPPLLNPYVGAIDFQAVANKQYPGVPFKEMDFVWSLRNAKSKPVAAPVEK